MLFETVFNNLISTVNTTVLSGCSETGVAATGSVGTVINMLILAFTALSVGASIAISNYLGAKEWKTARELVFVGVVLCVGIGALLSIVCFFAAGGIVSLLHLEGEVYVLAVAYFKIRVAALISLAAVSATVYYNNILCYAYIISYSLGSANSIFTGRLCGAGEFDHAERVNRLLVKCTAVANFLLSLLLFLFRRPLLSIYTDNPQIFAWATAVFAIDFVAEGARAVSHIYEYSLRGAGDVRCMMIAMIVSGWLCGVGGAYFFGIRLQMGVAGFFLATALDEVCRAVLSVWRWRTGKWKTIFAAKAA